MENGKCDFVSEFRGKKQNHLKFMVISSSNIFFAFTRVIKSKWTCLEKYIYIYLENNCFVVNNNKGGNSCKCIMKEVWKQGWHAFRLKELRLEQIASWWDKMTSIALLSVFPWELEFKDRFNLSFKIIG